MASLGRNVYPKRVYQSITKEHFGWLNMYLSVSVDRWCCMIHQTSDLANTGHWGGVCIRAGVASVPSQVLRRRLCSCCWNRFATQTLVGQTLDRALAFLTFSFLTASFTTSVPLGASTSVFPRNCHRKRR